MNPYSPPKSVGADSVAPRTPRPVSAWLLLTLLVLIAATFALGTIRFTTFLLTGWNEGKSVPLFAIAVVWRAALSALSIGAIIGILNREQWGRWLGLLTLSSIAALLILAPDMAPYANKAESTGGFIARRIVVPALLLWWAYAFAFSSKAKQYFINADRPNPFVKGTSRKRAAPYVER